MTHGPVPSLRRIGAIVRRHFYLLVGSMPRLFDLVYWPTVQMILWGFINRYLVGQSSLIAQAGGIFLSAILLWDILFRGQLGTSLCFIEEMYARHFGHLFVSPLRPAEFVAAVFTISTSRVLIGVGSAALLAWPIHHFSLVDALGWSLLPFFAVLLMFGWSLGLMIAGLLLRLGLGAENLAWGAIYFIQPLSGVFYPLSVLPQPARALAWVLPSAPVFEGMRAVMTEHRFDPHLFLLSVGLLLVWMGISAVSFLLLFRSARERGLLLQGAE